VLSSDMRFDGVVDDSLAVHGQTYSRLTSTQNGERPRTTRGRECVIARRKPSAFQECCVAPETRPRPDCLTP
jgi:hypothetical protein